MRITSSGGNVNFELLKTTVPKKIYSALLRECTKREGSIYTQSITAVDEDVYFLVSSRFFYMNILLTFTYILD